MVASRTGPVLEGLIFLYFMSSVLETVSDPEAAVKKHAAIREFVQCPRGTVVNDAFTHLRKWLF